MQQTELRRPPAARNGQLAASEVSEFTDSITGCAVRQLTGAALRSVHSYYDIPPWSPTSGQMPSPGWRRRGQAATSASWSATAAISVPWRRPAR